MRNESRVDLGLDPTSTGLGPKADTARANIDSAGVKVDRVSRLIGLYNFMFNPASSPFYSMLGQVTFFLCLHLLHHLYRNIGLL